jgi:hypothetical protein
MTLRHLAAATAAVCLLVAPAAAGPDHKNLQVLPKTITNAELKATMEGFTKQLGVKCTFCHVPDQYEKDDRPHKADARRMIRLVMDLKAKKAEYFARGTKDSMLNCALCHRGKAEPEPFATSLFGSLSLFPGGALGAGFKNLQVLPKNTNPEEMKKTMNAFSDQLGVKCEFCHSDNTATDDKPHKGNARRMMKLVANLKAKRALYFGPRVQEHVIACGLCHRGKAALDAL